jgi:hypothetical protein
MKYEFDVSYELNGQILKVQFPGISKPSKPVKKKLPEGQLIKTVHLGETIISDPDEEGGMSWRNHIACVRVGRYGAATKSVTIVYDGDGKFVKVKHPERPLTKAEENVPLENANVTKVSALDPLGLLLIFRFPDKTIVRCVQAKGGIVISPPSNY